MHIPNAFEQYLRLELYAPPTFLHFSLTVNYCILKQQNLMYITFNFSELWFIFCLEQPMQKAQKKKNTFKALHSE